MLSTIVSCVAHDSDSKDDEDVVLTYPQVLFFCTYAVYYGDLIANDGKSSGLWVWGTTLYIGILLTVLGKAALISE